MCRTINQIIVVNVYNADKCHLLSCFEDIVEVIVTHFMTAAFGHFATELWNFLNFCYSLVNYVAIIKPETKPIQ